MAIELFRGKYDFLSNFYIFENPIYDDMRLDYLTVENAYQAFKTEDRSERLRIRRLSPSKAKLEGRKLGLREDWDYIKRAVMLNFLTQKFLYNPHLLQLLFMTGDQKLVEGNHWGDTYWGVSAGVGQNHLGRLLMLVRSTVDMEESNDEA